MTAIPSVGATSSPPTPHTEMTNEERLVVQGLLEFTDQVAVPLQGELEERFPHEHQQFLEDGRERPEWTAGRREVRTASAKAGFYQMFTPTEIGGGGLGARLSFFCWEALYRAYGPGEKLAYNSISHWASGPSAVWTKVNDHLRREVLPSVMAGELSGCFGMSEPDAGSDAWRMKTRAVRDGDDWIINGSKQWTSFAAAADYILAFAVTDPQQAEQRHSGVSCFFVPADTPGFSIDSMIRLFGEAGGKEAIISLTDVRVSDSNRLGDLDRGFDLAMIGANSGRMYNTARSIALSRWAIDKATNYARVRSTFGKPISEHQAIQFMLADAATDVVAARAMALEVATKIDNGEWNRRDAAMAKLFATNAANRILDSAIQIHGGMGLTNEVQLIEAWKTVRTLRIADGTDEILRRTIGRDVVKNGLDI